MSSPPMGVNIPSINAIFCEKGLIFINLFDESETTNWHFLYDYENNTVSKALSTKLKCSR